MRKRKKRPEYVSDLVAEYNATLHTTTGHLLLGREATLPRDPVVINDQEETLMNELAK